MDYDKISAYLLRLLHSLKNLKNKNGDKKVVKVDGKKLLEY